MPAIEDVSKVFGTTRAVDRVSLSIAPGQFVGVIGRSGAGKSTLLRMINRRTLLAGIAAAAAAPAFGLGLVSPLNIQDGNFLGGPVS